MISRYGIMDLCGFPKDAYYYYRAWWQDEPVLHIFPHWNWRVGEEPIDVWCNSNCAEASLSLNGEGLGRKRMEKNGYLQWEVPYEPGRLVAEGFDEEGNLELTVVNETTGAPAGIDLKPDRQTMKADNKDLVVVNVSIVDEKGRVVPTAENLVVFSLEGPARILEVDNGNPISHEPDKSDRRRAFNGLCQVIVQSTWEARGIILRAASRGLKPSEIRLSSREGDQAP